MKSAILIDGENVVLSVSEALDKRIELDWDIDWTKLFEYLESNGYEVVISRLYINPFDLGRKPEVPNSLASLGIQVVLTSSVKKGDRRKSLSDPKLIVDGVSILYERPFIDALIIVSGDRDFIPLAEKARELDKKVLFVSISKTTAKPIKERFGWIELLAFIKTSSLSSEDLLHIPATVQAVGGVEE